MVNIVFLCAPVCQCTQHYLFQVQVCSRLCVPASKLVMGNERWSLQGTSIRITAILWWCGGTVVITHHQRQTLTWSLLLIGGGFLCCLKGWLQPDVTSQTEDLHRCCRGEAGKNSTPILLPASIAGYRPVYTNQIIAIATVKQRPALQRSNAGSLRTKERSPPGDDCPCLLFASNK